MEQRKLTPTEQRKHDEVIVLKPQIPSKHLLPLSRIQRIIAQRMVQAKRTIPMFSISAEIRVDALLDTRHAQRKKHRIRLTTNTFYMRAIAFAAEKYPLVIARIADDHLSIPSQINIGFAVDAPQGLVVPVLRGINEKTMQEIAQEEKILTEKARDNQLTPADFDDETIALSNLGIYDIDSFVAIVPPFTSSIIAAGKIRRDIVPGENGPEVARILNFSLTADARIVDEFYAAGFLSMTKDLLEDPERLL